MHLFKLGTWNLITETDFYLYNPSQSSSRIISKVALFEYFSLLERGPSHLEYSALRKATTFTFVKFIASFYAAV